MDVLSVYPGKVIDEYNGYPIPVIVLLYLFHYNALFGLKKLRPSCDDRV